MKLKKQDIDHIAWLSRISGEYGREEKDFEEILDYVGQLKSVSTENIVPTVHVFGITNIGRNDETKECVSAIDIIKCAPETKDGFVKVKAIL